MKFSPNEKSFVNHLKIIICNSLRLTYDGDYSHDTA